MCEIESDYSQHVIRKMRFPCTKKPRVIGNTRLRSYHRLSPADSSESKDLAVVKPFSSQPLVARNIYTYDGRYHYS